MWMLESYKRFIFCTKKYLLLSIVIILLVLVVVNYLIYSNYFRSLTYM